MNKEATSKEVVQTYFDSLASGNLDRLGQLFSEDVIWHQPGHGELSKTYFGKQDVFTLFGQFMNISQGSFKIDGVKSIMVNGDLVTATLHFSAGKPGKNIFMDGVDLMKVQDGKIKEVWLFSGDQEAEDTFWVSK
ncbi:MAG: nuclear transport factor 2 family protein [Bdellovibrionales bacterium]|nr:nuclear transport factor 2 family protein [Bdellovibrionales bacterium]